MKLTLDTDKQVFFYEQDFYILSNFSAFMVEWKGKWFQTAEAVYHWEKFPDYPQLQEIIRNCQSAHEAFKLAQESSGFIRPDWKDVRIGIMKDILWTKVRQHEYVRRKLLATGDREIVENSWRDAFWGWGEGRDGSNMLGKIWMEIRSELKSQNPVSTS